MKAASQIRNNTHRTAMAVAVATAITAITSLIFAGCGGGSGNSGVVNAPPPVVTYPAAPAATPTPAPPSASPGITVLAGTSYTPSGTNPGDVDGPGATATFSLPALMSLDASGNIYIYNNSISLAANSSELIMRKITPQGVVSTLSGFSLEAPFAIDSQGNFFGVGQIGTLPGATGGILKVSASGQATVLDANANLGSGSTDGPLAGATFDGPEAVAIDATGNLYIADTGNCTIRKVGANSVVSTFVGKAGSCGHVDGTGSAASFDSVGSMTFDSAGNLYVTDSTLVDAGTGENVYLAPTYSAIRKITPAGAVTTLAGSATTGNVDGTGSSASFYEPSSITSDTAGNLYVADLSTYPGNNTYPGIGLIRKITPAGVVTTVVGQANATTYAPTGALPGAFANATFSGIAWGGNGVLYAILTLPNANQFQDQILKIQFPQ